MSVRIYVEGGFENSTKTNCRRAFRRLFEKLVLDQPITVIASGDRLKAFRDFCSALRQHRDDLVILLVDAEGEVKSKSWQHLSTREGDGWTRPLEAAANQAHLMVQVMEAWFLADHTILIDYYGQGFLHNSLPGQRNIELIAKQDVFTALKHATRHTQKGEYHKTRHGFELLELCDPEKIRRASRHANELFEVLESKKQGNA